MLLYHMYTDASRQMLQASWLRPSKCLRLVSSSVPSAQAASWHGKNGRHMSRQASTAKDFKTTMYVAAIRTHHIKRKCSLANSLYIAASINAAQSCRRQRIMESSVSHTQAISKRQKRTSHFPESVAQPNVSSNMYVEVSHGQQIYVPTTSSKIDMERASKARPTCEAREVCEAPFVTAKRSEQTLRRESPPS